MGKPKHHRRSTLATPAQPLASPRSKRVNVVVYGRPSGYWYAQASDAKTGAPVSDASGYSRADAMRELRHKFAMIGVEIVQVNDLT